MFVPFQELQNLRLFLNDFGLREECNTGKRGFVTYRKGTGMLIWHQNFLKPAIFLIHSPYGFIVIALISGSSGPCSSPGQGHMLCCWARHLALAVYLPTQVYKWVPENLLLGVTFRWTSIPFRAG